MEDTNGGERSHEIRVLQWNLGSSRTDWAAKRTLIEGCHASIVVLNEPRKAAEISGYQSFEAEHRTSLNREEKLNVQILISDKLPVVITKTDKDFVVEIKKCD